MKSGYPVFRVLSSVDDDGPAAAWEVGKPGIGARRSEYCGGNSIGPAFSSISVCTITREEGSL